MRQARRPARMAIVGSHLQCHFIDSDRNGTGFPQLWNGVRGEQERSCCGFPQIRNNFRVFQTALYLVQRPHLGKASSNE